MSDLMTVCKEISTTERVSVTGQIMKMFRAITPQFYKNQTKDEIRAELAGIEACISNIEQPVLAKMCELAIQNYGIARSKNEKVFFDINYILTFYKQADAWKNRAKQYVLYDNHRIDDDGNLIDREFSDEELCEYYDKMGVLPL